ncbi:MAG: hypothetical protein JF615_15880, partial [Asticcacaulis sp.]|nr:hypothetical protein [Asticcacaulis sp.]
QLEALVAPGEALPAAALAAAIGEALAAAAGAWAAEIPADGLDALTRALTTGEFLGYNG